MKKGPVEISPVMEDLSSYIAGVLRKPLPRHVVERAKVSLVDTYAATISGSRLLPGQKALAYVKTLGGKPVASVLGTRLVTSAPNAALANGMFAHADETDDTHPATSTHPGSSIVPAVMAIGERNRLPGTAVLRAMVLGYDICARIIFAMDHLRFYHVGHNASAFGRLFGAAAASGALLKLDKRQVRYLLSYTAQQTAGLHCVLRDREHVQKAFLSGKPAYNAVTAALVVEQGYTGVEDVFAGKYNFFSTFAPATTFASEGDRSQLTRGLGRDYEILHGGVKRWSVGGPNQAPLQVLYELIGQHGLKAGDVQNVVIRMPAINLSAVDNRGMANISLQHLVAVMLLDGTMTFKSSHDYNRMKDPKVLALRERIEAVGDEEPPSAERSWRCSIEITLKDGRKLMNQTTAAKGTYENPMTRHDADEKALDLIAPVSGKRRAQELLAALWDFDRIKDVRALRKLASA